MKYKKFKFWHLYANCIVFEKLLSSVGDLMVPSTILKVQLSKYNIVISILTQKYRTKGIKIAKTKIPWGTLSSYGSWIYNYLFNQYPSPLKF